MRGKSMFCLLALGVLLVAAMPTNAQTGAEGLTNPTKATPTTLYFHIFDTFNAFPINTQMPLPDGFFKVGGTNFPTIVNDDADQNYDFNTIYGFATSGPVEYNFIENGQPRFHPERGIARDVQIDPATPAYAYIYVDVRDVLGQNSMPNLLPKFTVRVTMRDGNVIGPDSNLDANPEIMSGLMTAYLWSEKTAPPVQSVSDPDCDNAAPSPPDTCPVLWSSDGIIEYKIPLVFKDVNKPVIKKTDAYNVRVDWYQNPSKSAPGQDDRYAEGYMRLVSDNKHHPRLTMSIKNPVYLEFIHPEVAAGILLIHTAENSPWGTYDIDVENMTVEVTGPSTPSDLPVVVAQNSHVHNLHDKAAEVTYLWRFRADDATVEGGPAKEGDYHIKVTVQNMNHTATAIGEASFHVDEKSAYGIDERGQVVPTAAGGGEAESSPGASFLVIMVLVAGAVAIRRRKA